ncbi:hypothetical protein DL93DRAFT_2169891 [Clavulina sp. PMI_390]|nr:hypothetical protein DL93DRAFT_2174219 [Clavulina sp. PMI_390]KAF8310202.1 hypothetical protein DL93DRAFT_2169891 [Clavulina sp. PMI_390]
MKSLLLSAAVTAGLLALSAHGQQTFPYITDDTGALSGSWQYVRMTQNHFSQAPIWNVSDPLLRCYENNTASATSTITLTAGKTYSIVADKAIDHPGTLAVYMAKVADAATVASESAGGGATWFKIMQDAPYYNASAYSYVFPSQTATNITFTIPKATPSGFYLIRPEQIALHIASTYGGAQYFMACAQVQVIGGGTGTPGPLVSIPGLYTGYEPGILINIYEVPASGVYTPPGPAVWTG